MKKTITLALLLGIGCTTAFAQQSHSGKQAFKDRMKALKGATASAASDQKTTAVMQRLTGQASYYDMGTGPQLGDSMVYAYSSGRGSAFDFEMLDFNTYYYYPEFLLGTGYINYDSSYSVNNNTTSAKSYNAAGKTARQTFYYSPGASRNTWTYDAGGKVVSSLDESYNPVTMAWAPNYRTFYTYDGSGRLISDSSENMGMSGWDIDSKSEYTYNSSNQITGGTFYDWNGAGWDPQDRYTFTYTSGMITSSLAEEYNGTGWDNMEKIDITYTGNKKTSEIYYEWNGTTWDMTSEEYRSLNTANLPDSVFYRYYSSWTSSWDTTITKLAYNSFENPVSITYYDGAMNFTNSSHYYYQDYDPNKVKDVATAQSVTVYPNPAKDLLNITTKEMNAGQASYTVTNTLGQSVIRGTENVNGNKLTVDVQQLTPGMYWLSIQDAKGETYQAAFSK